MGFFSNPWVIGIGGGIVSGFLVMILSRTLFLRKDNKEYRQQVSIANNEVIHTLRSSISDENFPELEIVLALIESTSRKYKINSDDMNNIKEISEDLTKEILDTNFIYYDKKISLIEKLKDYYAIKKVFTSNKTTEVNDSKSELRINENEFSEYRRKLSQRMTIMLGTAVATLYMIVVIFVLEGDMQNIIERFSFSGTLVLIVTLFTLMYLLLSLTMRLLRDLRRSKKKIEEKSNEQQSQVSKKINQNKNL